MSSRRHAAVGFIFVTVALDMLALGIAVPTLPKLISDFVSGSTATAAVYLGIFTAVFALMQFLFSPLLGILSDRFGRRPVVLLSNFGLALDYMVMALAPSLAWLFVGRVLSGISASSVPTAKAYISDVTTPDKRSKAFGLIGAAFGIGFVIGPAVGGWLGMYSTRLPFWVAGAASLLNAIYGLFILPESLPLESRQTRIQWKRANPIGALRVFRSHAELWGLAGVNFLGYLAHEIYATVWILYVMYRFDWDQRMVGAGLAFAGVCSVICSGGLVGPTVARLGERRTLLLGLICGGLGFLLYGWAATVPIFFVAIAVNSLWSLANPASQSLMTRRVSASEQGELQGAIASLRGLAMIIGPPVFAEIFAFSLHGDHQQPSAPWYFAALLLAISLPVAWFVMKRNEGGAVHDCIVPVEVETNVE